MYLLLLFHSGLVIKFKIVNIIYGKH
ncbi:uncharacterized protein METZ01_LOCUS505409, partial [marine metagenome]